MPKKKPLPDCLSQAEELAAYVTRRLRKVSSGLPATYKFTQGTDEEGNPVIRADVKFRVNGHTLKRAFDVSAENAARATDAQLLRQLGNLAQEE